MPYRFILQVAIEMSEAAEAENFLTKITPTLWNILK